MIVNRDIFWLQIYHCDSRFYFVKCKQMCQKDYWVPFEKIKLKIKCWNYQHGDIIVMEVENIKI